MSVLKGVPAFFVGVVAVSFASLFGEDGFGFNAPRPTLERATDDADWIGCFRFQTGQLVDAELFKGHLPEGWTGGSADQAKIHPAFAVWLQTRKPVDSDIFIFGRPSGEERDQGRSWVLIGDISLNKICTSHHEFMMVGVDIKGRYITEASDIEAVVRFRVSAGQKDGQASFMTVRRSVAFHAAEPYKTLTYIPTIPSISSDWNNRHALLPPGASTDRLPSNVYYHFNAEQRFIAPLLKKLNAGNVWQRADAARCLRNYLDPKVVDALQRALSDPSTASTEDKVRGLPVDGLWYPVRQEAYNSLCRLELPVGDSNGSPTGVVPPGDCLHEPDRYGLVTLDVQELEENWGLEPINIPGYEPIPGIALKPVLPLTETLPPNALTPPPSPISKRPGTHGKRQLALVPVGLALLVGVVLGFVLGRRNQARHLGNAAESEATQS